MSKTTATVSRVIASATASISAKQNSNSTADSDVDNRSIEAIFVAFGTHAAIALGLIVAFSVFRLVNKRIYEPKSLVYPAERRLPPPLKGPLGWLSPIKTHDITIIDKIGPDAVVFLRFLRCLWRFFGILTIFAIPLNVINYLAPAITGHTSNINQSITIDGHEISNPLAVVQDFLAISPRQLSMVNVWEESYILYIYVGLAWAFSILIYVFFVFLWLEYIKIRNVWFSSEAFQQSISSRTLLLTNVPPSLQSVASLTQFFNTLLSQSKIIEVKIGREVTNLAELIEEHQKTTANFEFSLKKYLKDPTQLPSKRPMHREGQTAVMTLGLCGGEKVDSIKFYSEKLIGLEDEIYEIRSKGDALYKPNSSAFVVFESILDANVALKRLNNMKATISVKTGVITPPTIKLCPNTDDLIWENIGMPSTLRYSRRLISYGLVTGLTISWAFILTFVGTLVSIQNFEKINGFGAWIKGNKFAHVFITAIFAPVVMATLSSYLPKILRMIGQKFQGISSISGVEKSLLFKLYFFHLFQVVVLMALGTVYKTLKDDLKNQTLKIDGKYLQAMARAAAQGFLDNATFYLVYLLAGAAGYAMELSQAISVVTNFVSRLFARNTPRQIADQNKPKAIAFSSWYGSLLLFFLVAFTYAVVAPLLTPIAFILFFFAYLVLKYQIYYVAETKHETGGAWWPKVFLLACISVSFAQAFFGCVILLILGTLTTNAGRIVTILSLILPLTGIAFYIICILILLPRSQYANLRTLANDTQFPTKPTTGSHIQAHNPLLGKALWKVWVTDEAKPILPSIYKPKYEDFNDYLVKTGKVVGDGVQEYHDRGMFGRFNDAVGVVGKKTTEITGGITQGVAQGVNAVGMVGKKTTEFAAREVYDISTGIGNAFSGQQKRRENTNVKRVEENYELQNYSDRGYERSENNRDRYDRSDRGYERSDTSNTYSDRNRHQQQSIGRLNSDLSSQQSQQNKYSPPSRSQTYQSNEYSETSSYARTEKSSGYGQSNTYKSQQSKQSSYRDDEGGYNGGRYQQQPQQQQYRQQNQRYYDEDYDDRGYDNSRARQQSMTAITQENQKAKDQVTVALNKGTKPAKIFDKIIIKDLNMGTVPPDLEILEIGDSRKNVVGANPLIEKETIKTTILGKQSRIIATNKPLVNRGVTLVFKNDPLEEVDVNSTFDNIPNIRRFLQKQIEEQLRKLFQEDLPPVDSQSLPTTTTETNPQDDSTKVGPLNIPHHQNLTSSFALDVENTGLRALLELNDMNFEPADQSIFSWFKGKDAINEKFREKTVIIAVPLKSSRAERKHPRACSFSSAQSAPGFDGYSARAEGINDNEDDDSVYSTKSAPIPNRPHFIKEQAPQLAN
ncbi:hypothetical protein HK098_002874 [Nowakowskiella sp. JEL0407]|nr:hypothetical protein HK098_002874 [Nowakowskiella sp. JEL0407]